MTVFSTENNKDYPSLFYATDTESKNSQNIYFLLILVELILSLLTVLSSSFSIDSLKKNLAIGVFIFMFLALVSTICIKIFRLDKKWFINRAVAESVKSLTWLYMMQAQQFINLSEPQANQIFGSGIKSFLEECKEYSFLGGEFGEGEQITGKMREIKSSTFSDKKKIYLSLRLNDQKSWYSKKSAFNKKSKNLFLILIGASQVVAFICAGFMIFNTNSSINFVAFFASLSMSFLGWTQLKQHQLLTQSYGIAAQELGVIGSKIQSPSCSEQEFLELVSESEAAISREHKLWIAHREAI